MGLPFIVGITTGVTVAVKPSFRWVAFTVGVFLMGLSHRGGICDRVQMRIETYRITLIASLEHPWVGVGQNPLAEPIMLHEHHAPLPSIHSSWLSLLFHHGVPVVVLVAVGVLQIAIRTPSPRYRGALIGLSVLGLADDVLRWPGLLACGVWILLKAYQEAWDENV